MHAYGIQKNDTDEPIFQGRNRDPDIENGLVDTVGGKRGWGELREHH